VTAVLIANRGEVAVRIARAAAEIGLRSVAIHSIDDADSAHVHAADAAVALDGSGPAAYLDIDMVIAAARAEGCTLVHPGYGFLSENADFAERAAAAGLIFVGPCPDTLRLFGDKSAARAFMAAQAVPIIEGLPAPATREQVAVLLAGGPIMIKAVSGGGGRGMRIVADAAELDEAFARCAAEAAQAFGNGALYAERLFPAARHIEVQIVGDGRGDVIHLWDRDCSCQRARQKLVEIAPAPALDPALRERILSCAVQAA